MSSGPSEIISAEQKAVFSLLQKRAGLIFPDSRLGEVKGFINQAAKSAQLTVAEYGSRLKHDNSMFDELCNQVTIAETYFFRDPKQFDFVRHTLIPVWIKETMMCQRSEPIHVLSAGCSTGEEAYSLAIMFDQEGLHPASKISATDICKRSLGTAAKANYGPWSLRTSDDNFRSLHFESADSRFSLREKYRSRVNFAHLNLLEDTTQFAILGLTNLDLIFCRNVLIYLDADAIARVVTTLHSLLKPGGHLILGPSDPAAAQFASFEVIVCDYGVFYKKSTDSQTQTHTHTQTTSSTLPSVPGQTAQSIGHSTGSGSGHAGSQKGNKAGGHAGSHAGGHQSVKRPSARKHQGEVNRLPPIGATTGSAEDLLAQANMAYSHGQYEKAFSITGIILDDAQAAALHIKSLANFKDSIQAEKILKKIIGQHANNFELHYLHGHLLMDLDRLPEAMAALKRCVYLDSRATMAHFALALVQRRLNDRDGAEKSFRNVIELCKGQLPDQLLPHGDGKRVQSVTAAATAALIAMSQS